MKLSRDEVQILRAIEQLQSSAVAMSPAFYREWCKVVKDGEDYAYREPIEGTLAISICLDRYPPCRAYMKRGNVK